MTRHRMNPRSRTQLDGLYRMAAPGCEPWKLEDPICPTGKRRLPTEHAAASALRNAQQLRVRRAKGKYRGKLENRAYACGACGGFHLTSLTAEEYESRRD